DETTSALVRAGPSSRIARSVPRIPAPVPMRGGAMLTDEHRRFYREHGYVVVGGLFAPDEAARYRDHFMGLRRRGDYAGDFAGVDAGDRDPLKLYPRMIHMHRWDEVSLGWLLDARINACLTGLIGREPYAGQTMLYFKPPGARAQ